MRAIVPLAGPCRLRRHRCVIRARRCCCCVRHNRFLASSFSLPFLRPQPLHAALVLACSPLRLACTACHIRACTFAARLAPTKHSLLHPVRPPRSLELDVGYGTCLWCDASCVVTTSSYRYGILSGQKQSAVVIPPKPAQISTPVSGPNWPVWGGWGQGRNGGVQGIAVSTCRASSARLGSPAPLLPVPPCHVQRKQQRRPVRPPKLLRRFR